MQGKRINCTCEVCGASFLGRPSYVAKGWDRFCGKPCANSAMSVPVSERFWSKVNKSGPTPLHVPELGPCWVWTAGLTDYGYGQINVTVGGRKQPDRAHRIAWVEANGPIPSETPCVLHKCDNPPCVRPDHLWLGTRTENNEDKRRKGRSATGERHFSRTSPERVARGESKTRTAKLKVGQVVEIRTRYASGGVLLRELAEEFGVTESGIWSVIHRRSWKAVK